MAVLIKNTKNQKCWTFDIKNYPIKFVLIKTDDFVAKYGLCWTEILTLKSHLNTLKTKLYYFNLISNTNHQNTITIETNKLMLID